jgi:hypothetical protein
VAGTAIRAADIAAMDMSLRPEWFKGFPFNNRHRTRRGGMTVHFAREVVGGTGTRRGRGDGDAWVRRKHRAVARKEQDPAAVHL